MFTSASSLGTVNFSYPKWMFHLVCRSDLRYIVQAIRNIVRTGIKSEWKGGKVGRQLVYSTPDRIEFPWLRSWSVEIRRNKVTFFEQVHQSEFGLNAETPASSIFDWKLRSRWRIVPLWADLVSRCVFALGLPYFRILHVYLYARILIKWNTIVRLRMFMHLRDFRKWTIGWNLNFTRSCMKQWRNLWIIGILVS